MKSLSRLQRLARYDGGSNVSSVPIRALHTSSQLASPNHENTVSEAGPSRLPYQSEIDPLSEIRALLAISPDERPRDLDQGMWTTYQRLKDSGQITQLNVPELQQVRRIIDPLHSPRKITDQSGLRSVKLRTVETYRQARAIRRGNIVGRDLGEAVLRHRQALSKDGSGADDTSRLRSSWTELALSVQHSLQRGLLRRARAGQVAQVEARARTLLDRRPGGPTSASIVDAARRRQEATETDRKDTWTDSEAAADSDLYSHTDARGRRPFPMTRNLGQDDALMMDRAGWPAAYILQHRLRTLERRLKAHARSPQPKTTAYDNESFAWVFLHIISAYQPFQQMVNQLVNQAGQSATIIMRRTLFRPNPPPVPSELQPLDDASLRLIVSCADLIAGSLEPKFRGVHISKKPIRFAGNDREQATEDVASSTAPQIRRTTQQTRPIVQRRVRATLLVGRVRREHRMAGKTADSPYLPIFEHLIKNVLQGGYGLDADTLVQAQGAQSLDLVGLLALMNYHRRKGNMWKAFAAYEVFTNPSSGRLDEDDADDEEQWPIEYKRGVDEGLGDRGEVSTPRQGRRTYRHFYIERPRILDILKTTPDGQLPAITPLSTGVQPNYHLTMLLLSAAEEGHDMHAALLALRMYNDSVAEAHNATMCQAISMRRWAEKRDAMPRGDRSSPLAFGSRIDRPIWLAKVQPPVITASKSPFKQMRLLPKLFKEERAHDNLPPREPKYDAEGNVIEFKRDGRPVPYEFQTEAKREALGGAARWQSPKTLSKEYTSVVLDMLHRLQQEWILHTGTRPRVSSSVLQLYASATDKGLDAPDIEATYREMTAEMKRLGINPLLADAVSDKRYTGRWTGFHPAHHLVRIQKVAEHLTTDVSWTVNEIADRERLAQRKRLLRDIRAQEPRTGPAEQGDETALALEREVEEGVEDVAEKFDLTQPSHNARADRYSSVVPKAVSENGAWLNQPIDKLGDPDDERLRVEKELALLLQAQEAALTERDSLSPARRHGLHELEARWSRGNNFFKRAQILRRAGDEVTRDWVLQRRQGVRIKKRASKIRRNQALLAELQGEEEQARGHAKGNRLLSLRMRRQMQRREEDRRAAQERRAELRGVRTPWQAAGSRMPWPVAGLRTPREMQREQAAPEP